MNKVILVLISSMFFTYESLAMDEEYKEYTNGGAYVELLRQEEENKLRKRNKILSYNQEISKEKINKVVNAYTSEDYFILGMKEFKARRYDNALDYLERASAYAFPQFENYDAEYTVGTIYEFMKNDYKQAEHWYSLAENHGDKEAAKAKKRVIQKNSSFFPYFY